MNNAIKILYTQVCVCVCVSAQSCPTLYDPMDYSLTGSSIHGILQARILEWVAIPSSRDPPDPGIHLVSCIFFVDRLFTAKPPWKPIYTHMSSYFQTLHFQKEIFWEEEFPILMFLMHIWLARSLFFAFSTSS